METLLFVCKANVGRSQIAEWLYNSNMSSKLTAISIAWSEARKIKYFEKPAEAIITFMKNNQWIDISHQRINYITDFSKEVLNKINRVIYLYDPEINLSCDLDCNIHDVSPFEYLKRKGYPIQISPVEDPYETWEKWYQWIVNRIQEIISKL